MKILDLNNLPIKYIKYLNAISNEIKIDFHVLVEQIYNATDGSIDWIVNSLLSRNNYLSRVFVDLCYVELIKRILEKEHVSKIIVLNNAQKQVVQFYIKRINSSTSVICLNGLVEKLYDIITPFKAFIANFITASQQAFLRNKKRPNKLLKLKNITLTDVFFIPSMFNNGEYIDRYYQDLDYYLTKDQKKNFFFVPTILFRKNLKTNVRISEEANEQFIYKFDFLHLSDYFNALLSPLRIKKINLNSFKFRGLKIAPILKSDFNRNIANVSSFLGILNYHFFKRLKQNNIKLRFVINWFENQVNDRGFNMGKNYFFPEVPSIGYQSFIIPFDYNFYLQPTDLEFKKEVIPDKIAVIGKGLIKDVKKYCPELPVVTAPALRFKNIHKQNLDLKRKHDSKINILVALPMSLSDSRDIARLIVEAKQGFGFQQANFIIKPHPALRIEKLKNEFGDLFDEDSNYFTGIFSEIIVNSDILIGSNSSVCIEALAYGVPVVVVGSQKGFTQNPISEEIPKTVWELCYTSEQLIGAINRLCYKTSDSNNYEDRYLISKQVRQDYFEPVNKKSVLNFLNLE